MAKGKRRRFRNRGRRTSARATGSTYLRDLMDAQHVQMMIVADMYERFFDEFFSANDYMFRQGDRR